MLDVKTIAKGEPVPALFSLVCQEPRGTTHWRPGKLPTHGQQICPPGFGGVGHARQ